MPEDLQKNSQNLSSIQEQIAQLQSKIDAEKDETKKSDLEIKLLELQKIQVESENTFAGLENNGDSNTPGLIVNPDEVEIIIETSKNKSDQKLEPIADKLPTMSKEEQKAAKERIENVLNPEREQSEMMLQAQRRKELGASLYNFMTASINNIGLPTATSTEAFLNAKTLSEFRALNANKERIQTTVESYKTAREIEAKENKTFLGISVGMEANMASAKMIGNALFTAVSVIGEKVGGALNQANFANKAVDGVTNFFSEKILKKEARVDDKVINTTNHSFLDRANEVLSNKLNMGRNRKDMESVPSYSDIQNTSLSNVDAIFARKEQEMIAGIDKRLDLETRDKCILQIRLYILLEKEDLVKQVKAKINAAEFLSGQDDYNGSLSSVLSNLQVEKTMTTAINMASSTAMLLAGPGAALFAIAGRVTASNLQANFAEALTMIKAEGKTFGESLFNPEAKTGSLVTIESTLKLVLEGKSTMSKEQFEALVIQLKTIQAKNTIDNNIYGETTSDKITEVLAVLDEIGAKEVFGGINHDLEIARNSITSSEKSLNDLTKAYSTIADVSATPAQRKEAQGVIDAFYAKAEKQANSATYKISLGPDPKTGEERIWEPKKSEVRWLLTLFGSVTVLIRQIHKLQENADLLGIKLDLTDIPKVIQFIAEDTGRNITKTAENIGKVGEAVGEKLTEIPGDLLEAGKQSAEVTIGFVDALLHKGVVEMAGQASENFKEMSAEMFASILNSSTWGSLHENASKFGINVAEINQKLRATLAHFFPSQSAAVNSINLPSVDGKQIHGLVVSNHVSEEMMAFYKAKGFVPVDSSNSSTVLVQETDIPQLSKDPSTILENLKPEDIVSDVPKLDPNQISGIKIHPHFVEIPLDTIDGDVSFTNVKSVGVVGAGRSGQMIDVNGKAFVVDRVVYNKETNQYRLILCEPDLTPKNKLAMNDHFTKELGEWQDKEWRSFENSARLIPDNIAVSVGNLKDVTSTHKYLINGIKDADSVTQLFAEKADLAAIQDLTTRYGHQEGGNYVLSFKEAQKLLAEMSEYPNDTTKNTIRLPNGEYDPNGSAVLTGKNLLQNRSAIRNLLAEMKPGSTLIVSSELQGTSKNQIPVYITFNSDPNYSAEFVHRDLGASITYRQEQMEFWRKIQADQENIDTSGMNDTEKAKITDKINQAKQAIIQNEAAIDALNKQPVKPSHLTDIQTSYESMVGLVKAGTITDTDSALRQFASDFLTRSGVDENNLGLSASIIKGGANLTPDQREKAVSELAEIYWQHLKRNGYTKAGVLEILKKGGDIKVTDASGFMKDLSDWQAQNPLGIKLQGGGVDRTLRTALSGKTLDAGEMGKYSQGMDLQKARSGWTGVGDSVEINGKIPGVDATKKQPFYTSPTEIKALGYLSERNPNTSAQSYVDQAALFQKYPPKAPDGKTLGLGYAVETVKEVDDKILEKMAKYSSGDIGHKIDAMAGQQGLIFTSKDAPDAVIDKFVDDKYPGNENAITRELIKVQLKDSSRVREANAAFNAMKVIQVVLGVGAFGAFGKAMHLKTMAAYNAKMKAQELSMAGKVATPQDLAEIRKLSGQQEIWQLAGQAATTLLLTGLNPVAGAMFAATVYGSKAGLGAAAKKELVKRYATKEAVFETKNGASGEFGNPDDPLFLKIYGKSDDSRADTPAATADGRGQWWNILIPNLPTGVLEMLANSSQVVDIEMGLNPDDTGQVKQTKLDYMKEARKRNKEDEDDVSRRTTMKLDRAHETADHSEYTEQVDRRQKETQQTLNKEELLKKKAEMLKVAIQRYERVLSLLQYNGITTRDLEAITLGGDRTQARPPREYKFPNSIADKLGVYNTDANGTIGKPVTDAELVVILNQIATSSTLLSAMDLSDDNVDNGINNRFFVKMPNGNHYSLPTVETLELIVDGLKIEMIETTSHDLKNHNQRHEFNKKGNEFRTGKTETPGNRKTDDVYPTGTAKQPGDPQGTTPPTGNLPPKPKITPPPLPVTVPSPGGSQRSLPATAEELRIFNNAPAELPNLDRQLSNLLVVPNRSSTDILRLVDQVEHLNNTADKAEASLFGSADYARAVNQGRLQRTLDLNRLCRQNNVSPTLTDQALADVQYLLNHSDDVGSKDRENFEKLITSYRNTLKQDLQKELTSPTNDTVAVSKKVDLAKSLNAQSVYKDSELSNIIKTVRLNNLRTQSEQQKRLRLMQDKIEVDLRNVFASSNGSISQDFLTKYIDKISKENNLGPLQAKLIQNHVTEYVNNYNNLQELKAKNPNIQQIVQSIYPDQNFTASEVDIEVAKYHPDTLIVEIAGNPPFMKNSSAIAINTTEQLGFNIVAIGKEQTKDFNDAAKIKLVNHELSHITEMVQQSVVNNSIPELPNEDRGTFLTQVGNEILGNLQQFGTNVPELKKRIDRYFEEGEFGENTLNTEGLKQVYTNAFEVIARMQADGKSNTQIANALRNKPITKW